MNMSDMNAVLYELEIARSSLELREAHQVGTQAETGTLTSRQADRGRQEIQQSEGHGGHDGHSQDFLHIQLLLGDDEGGQRNGQTLQEILDRASHQLSHSETVHPYIQVRENYNRNLGNRKARNPQGSETACAVNDVRLKPGIH